MAPTQVALYEELADDPHLSWSEAELPERERRGLMSRRRGCAAGAFERLPLCYRDRV